MTQQNKSPQVSCNKKEKKIRREFWLFKHVPDGPWIVSRYFLRKRDLLDVIHVSEVLGEEEEGINQE